MYESVIQSVDWLVSQSVS